MKFLIILLFKFFCILFPNFFGNICYNEIIYNNSNASYLPGHGNFTTLPTTKLTTVLIENSTKILETKLCPIEFNICQNNGTCLITDTGSISCKCSIPYTGLYCQNQNNFCDLLPCKNGGTCIQGITNDGECICSPGYFGKTCNTRTCDAINPCKNSLACLIIDMEYNCYCLGGFTGKYCENRI